MYLGIDLGTSGIKAVVIDEAGGLVAQTSVPLTVSNPQPLWSEQDPEEWWQGLLLALGQLGQQIPLKSIRSMGLAGHMHGATLLDQDGKILRPCILWNDGRSYQEIAVDLGRHVKSIDNALQRVKRKMEKLLEQKNS